MAACIGAVLAAAPAGVFCAKAGRGLADGTLACNVRNRSRPSQRIGVVSMKKKKSYAIASAVLAAMPSQVKVCTISSFSRTSWKLPWNQNSSPPRRWTKR